MSGCSASTDGTHAAAACCSTPSCDRQSRASPSPTGRCARPDGPDRRRNRHAEHGSYRPAWTWDDPNCLGVFEVLRREVRSGGIKMETPFYAEPGNLELIARAGDQLDFYWRDCGPWFNWNGPYRIAEGVAGNPA